MNIRTLGTAAAGAALLALGAGSAQAQVFGFGGSPNYGGYGGYGLGAVQCEFKAQQQRALTNVLGSVIGANSGYGYGYGSGYGTSTALGVLGDVMVQGARDRCYQEQARNYGYGAPGYGQGYGYPTGYGYPPVQSDPYGYGGYGYPGYGAQGYGHGRPGECRYAPSTVQLPDGRVQRRDVRVCADRYGQFQVR